MGVDAKKKQGSKKDLKTKRFRGLTKAQEQLKAQGEINESVQNTKYKVQKIKFKMPNAEFKVQSSKFKNTTSIS